MNISIPQPGEPRQPVPARGGPVPRSGRPATTGHHHPRPLLPERGREADPTRAAATTATTTAETAAWHQARADRRAPGRQRRPTPGGARGKNLPAKCKQRPSRGAL